jgi:polyhydroxyalkanoate synthase subunit PhaC
MTIQILEHTQPTQQTHDGQEVSLNKAILSIEGPNHPTLGVVHKWPLESPPKAALILVHGFAQNRYTWHCSTRSLSAWFVDQGFETYNLELRGHGRSRKEGQIGAECFDDYVQDVIILANAISKPAFWLGHSLGGAAIYGAAATMKPLKCLGVIGLGAVFHFAKANPTMRALCLISHKLRHIPIIEHLQIKTRMGGNFLSSLYSITDILGYTFPLSGWWPGTIEPELVQERLLIGFDWTSVKVWLEMARWGSTNHFDYEEEWAEVDVPLFVILGDKDHLLTPESGIGAYELSGSNNKRMVIMDDFYHNTHWGHLDLVIGQTAPQMIWEPIAEWMNNITTNSKE